MLASYHSTKPPQCRRSVYFCLSGEQTRHSNLLHSHLHLHYSLVLWHTTSTEKLESVHFALNSSLSSFALYPSSKQSSPGAFQLSLSVTQLDRLHLNPPMHSTLFSLDKRIMHFSYCMDIRECLPLNQSLSTMQTEHFLLLQIKNPSPAAAAPTQSLNQEVTEKQP